MRKLFLIAMTLGLFSCQSAPESQLWKQSGKTDQQGQEDYGHCEKVAMQEANGMRSTDVFKEDAIKEQCMRRLGYARGRLANSHC